MIKTISINERINREPGNDDAWICICGNRPINAGFYPCNDNGDFIEPDEASGWVNLYICAEIGCGRIIDMDTLTVVGRNLDPDDLT